LIKHEKGNYYVEILHIRFIRFNNLFNQLPFNFSEIG
jgi:hypothetical protein